MPLKFPVLTSKRSALSLLKSIMHNRVVRTLLVLLFCVVGVMRIKNFGSDATKQYEGEDERPSRMNFKQEVQDVKIVKIRTTIERDFCIAANVIQGEIEEFERITLLLHASHDRVGEKVLEQVQNWNGPISLAVAFPEGTEFDSIVVKCTIDRLLELQVINADVRRKLSVHFLSKNVSECADFLVHGSSASAHEYHRQIPAANCKPKSENLTADQLAERFVDYPVNRARNVARKFATTKYILSADMDHHFSDKFEEKMLELAEKELTKNPKTVLVYRIFEVSKKAQLPKTKKDLLKLYIEGTAQEFHKYYGAHSIPKLYDWFMHDGEKGEMEVQYYKPYTTHHWEPQFVSLNNIPEHDESFMYSVRDNTCLRWEMCRAGFKFAIVQNVFMFHPGFKEAGERSILTKARRIVGKKQKQIVSDFNKRLDKMYKTTKKSCPNYE